MGRRLPGKASVNFTFPQFHVTILLCYGFLGVISRNGLGIKDYWFVLLNLFVCIYALFDFTLVSRTHLCCKKMEFLFIMYSRRPLQVEMEQYAIRVQDTSMQMNHL